ncbi:hypothetical protein Tco_1191051, partial [Tanacetum coccineum]
GDARAWRSTSGDAWSCYMISEDAKSWVICIYSLSYCTIVHCFEIFAQLLGFSQTYELTNIIVDVFEYHFQIMPPRMRTRSAGRPVAESQGGGMGERVGRGGKGRGPRGVCWPDPVAESRGGELVEVFGKAERVEEPRKEMIDVLTN